MHRPEQHPAVARLLARLPRGLPDAARRGRAHVGPTYCSRLWCVMEIFTFARSECLPRSNLDGAPAPPRQTVEALPHAAARRSMRCSVACVPVGGAQERVEIHLIAHPDDDQAEARRRLTEQFAGFDAAKAQCFLPSDREHLLAVIEAGFGDFDDFNRVARTLLATRISRGDSSSWSSVNSV